MEVTLEESEPSQLDKHKKRFQALTERRLTYEEYSPKTKGHDGLGGMQLIMIGDAHCRPQPDKPRT